MPGLGTFAQADSWEGELGNPQTLNPYFYTLGNPFKYVDPSGHRADPPVSGMTLDEFLNDNSFSMVPLTNKKSSSKTPQGEVETEITSYTVDSSDSDYYQFTTGDLLLEILRLKRLGDDSYKQYGDLLAGKAMVDLEWVTAFGATSPIKFFRGGRALDPRLGIDVIAEKESGLLKTDRGLSLNVDPSKLEKFGGAYAVESIPEGLKIIQRGKPGHYELVPGRPMSIKEYKDLLNNVKLSDTCCK